MPLIFVRAKHSLELLFHEMPLFTPYAFLSSPINNSVSLKYMCGGTSKLSGAGLFLNTRPAKSNVEPWHGLGIGNCEEDY